MDNLGQILESANRLIESSKELNMELDEIKRCEEFLIEEYKRNKNYFRLEPGKATIEDVIKTCFEFGWSSRRLFDIKKKKTMKDNKESKGTQQDIEVLYQTGDTTSKEYMLVFKYNGMKFRIRIQHNNGTPLGFNYKCCLQVMLPDGTFSNLVDCSDLKIRWQNQYFIQNIDPENNERAIEAFKDYVKKVYS